MAKAIHMMIRVLDEEKSLKFYGQAFSLTVADRRDFDSFTLVYLSNDQSDFEVELTINKNNSKPYEMGTAYGHLAFCVDDLDAEHQRFSVAGFSPRKITDFEHNGELLARFFFVQDPDGYEIEVLQRHGRYH